MSYNIVQAAAGFGNTTLGCAGLGCGVIPGVPFAGLGATVLNPYFRGVATNTSVSANAASAVPANFTVAGRATETMRGSGPITTLLSEAAVPTAPPAEDDTLFYIGVAVAAAAILGGVWYFTQ